MNNVHHLVRTHGRDEAKRLIGSDRASLVDIAARMLEESSPELAITYSGFCLSALPHRRIPDDNEWLREGARVKLLVEPGQLPVGGKLKTFGVPYGSRARLILLYLQTQAIQQDSPEVELGRSMNDWLARMDIPVGGKTYADVREQASRISACRLTFFWQDDRGADAFHKDNIVRSGINLSANPTPGQGMLWDERVELSPTFFSELKRHPVPISEPAVRLISGKSMALDVYIWLAYRLHVLTKPTPITWAALHGQFGAGYKHVFQFKPGFKQALDLALAVYPDARVDIEDAGIVLHPSRPPIPEREIGRIAGR